jgi:NADH:ubiquinone oxidoreductase subunit C
MVFCNFCITETDQNYTCNHCGSNLKEGRRVTCQFTNTFCDFKHCNLLLGYKEVVWNVNYNYFHLTCYEKKLKMGVLKPKLSPIGNVVKKITKISGKHDKNIKNNSDQDPGKDIFGWFKKQRKENKPAEVKSEEGDVMSCISGIDWPTAAQIDESIGNLKNKSNRDEIRYFQVAKNMMDDPLTFPGQFARVYKMLNTEDNNKSVALRFFSKKKEGSMNRYRILHEYFEPYFEKDMLNFFINFNFVKDAVKININKKQYLFPVIKMDWIEGETLEKFLQDHSSEIKIKKIKNSFKKIVDEMDSYDIAHGDLHPKNIIIAKNGEIKLVDYDCLFIKKFSGDDMPELGDPDCQHPNRKNFKYDHAIDRFSAFVLYFALSILEDNPEFSDIRDGEFIFSRADYENPEQSETFKKISEIQSPETQYFLKILKDICKKKKPLIEPLSLIVENIPSAKEDNNKK